MARIPKLKSKSKTIRCQSYIQLNHPEEEVDDIEKRMLSYEPGKKKITNHWIPDERENPMDHPFMDDIPNVIQK